MTKKENHFKKDHAYRRLEALLRANLYRRNCPAPEILAQYQLNLLSPEKKLLVAQHVRACPHCQRELSELAREAEEMPSLLERLRQAKGLIEAQLSPEPRWATAGLRGAARKLQRFYTEALEIHISQQPGYSPGRWMLLGRLEIRDKTSTATWGREIWLIQGEEAWMTIVEPDGTCQVDRCQDEVGLAAGRGTFAFEEVLPGTYDLGLEWDGQPVMIRGVQVQ